MAKMYPEDIGAFKKVTEGQRALFRFIKEAARPHKGYICWFSPPVGGQKNRPDFVLYGKDLGLLVMKVKDWHLQRITAATPRRFSIRISGKDQIRANPDREARACVKALVEKLKEIPDLLSHQPSQVGELKIPIGRMVVFPNMEREAYRRRGLQWLIPEESAMFQNDLSPDGDSYSDGTGAKFLELISGAVPFRFNGLTNEEIDKVTDLLWPVSTIELPQRQGAGREDRQDKLRHLDDVQKRLALKLGRGHQVIKGPPGSGKTLVLVHRCSYLYKYHPQVKRILFVCYNIALVSYLKKLIREKGVAVGEGGVEVYHFFELCARILNEPVHFENEDAVYYDRITNDTLLCMADGNGDIDPFDAIFIDEGQDFNSEMLKVIMKLLSPGGDLIIGLDSYQDLYRRRASWKSLGITASGRTRTLKRVYRNTVEIFDFTQRFIGEKHNREPQMALLPDDFVFSGELPTLCRFSDFDALEDFLIDDLFENIKGGDYHRSEIAIIYDDKIYGPGRFAYDNRALPMRLLRKLEAAGIPTHWVSQDVRAKEMFEVTTDKISLISIHSAKGLDFDLVYLLGVDHINLTDKARKSLITLVYVAMTRAKHRLVVPYVKESELIKRMKECLEQ